MPARNEPPDRLDLLKAQHADLVRAIEETGYGDNPPRLRDRNGFVNALMHGERDTLERVRPRWQRYQRNVGRASRLEAEIGALITQKVMAEAGYRALVAEADKEAKAGRSCRKLLDAIRAAREAVTHADTNTPADAPRAAVKREMDQVSDRLDQVRRHVDELRTNLTGGRGFHPGELAGLRVEHARGDDHKKRGRKLTELGVLLGSLERTVKPLLDEISARENEIRGRQRKYMSDGRARYGG